MKILKYYDDVLSANIDRELLADQGIPSEVLNENMAAMLPSSMSSIRPYLVVPDGFYDQAARLVGCDGPDEVRCTRCGSAEVSPAPPKKRKGPGRRIRAAFDLIRGPFADMGGQYHCNDCGYKFRA